MLRRGYFPVNTLEHTRKPTSVPPLTKLLLSPKSVFSAFLFVLSRFPFTITDDSNDSKRREGSILTPLRTEICNSTLFFISNNFISNTRLKLAKNQPNSKQHPEAELCCLKIMHILHAKIRKHKKKQKNKCVWIHEIIRLIIMKIKKKKNRSHMQHK